MIQATLIRQDTGDHGTFGAILFPRGFAIHTLELPWEENKQSVSCIPCGLYLCEMDQSPRWGMTYHVRDVPGRTHILFHKGNWAGRKSMPELQTKTAGCILVGSDRGPIPPYENQDAVRASGQALVEMMTHLKEEPFELLILSRVEDETFVWGYA